MIIVGIDPGVWGGLVALGDNGDDILLAEEGSFALGHIYPHLLHYATIDAEFIIERQSGGKSAKQNYGEFRGMMAGITYVTGKELSEVHARTWQKDMLKGVEGEGKERSLNAAMALWPDGPWITSRGRHRDGLTDAALIARWLWSKKDLPI